jgi:hypothetical protein
MGRQDLAYSMDYEVIKHGTPTASRLASACLARKKESTSSGDIKDGGII